VPTAQQVDAKKSTMSERDALGLLDQVDEVYAAKGKQVVHLDLRREKPDRETLRKLLLGPTGNLRAPTLRVGKTLIVGFDEATYRKLLRS
jgi:arsenate reductase-like glutaredoxin family protein